jgi:RNA polymerase sigma factor (sigma-70 family)
MSRHRLVKQLWSVHRSALQTFFRRRIVSGVDAADLTQEVYLRLLLAGGEREIANPEAYLFTVARNLLTEHAVSQRKWAQHPVLHGALVASELGMEPTAESQLDHVSQVRVLRAAIEELPDPQKAALIMAYQHDMSYAEIAKKLNVHRSMVGKYVLQALKLCRRRLKREGAT